MDACVGMSASWCGLLAYPSAITDNELIAGTGGLAAAVVLCSSPQGCAAFVAGGGVEALAGGRFFTGNSTT